MKRFVFSLTIALFSLLPTVANEPASTAPSSGATLRSQADNDAIIVRAAMRIPDLDLEKFPAAKDAIERHIARQVGQSEYLSLVQRFSPADAEAGVTQTMLTATDDTVAINALRWLLGRPDGATRFTNLLAEGATDRVARLSSLLGSLSNQRAISVLVRYLSSIDPDSPSAYELRAAVMRGLCKNNLGGAAVLDLAEKNELPADVRLLAGGLLAASADPAIASRAASILPPPAMSDQTPLAPLDELVRLTGDVAHGATLFRGVATCGNCHLVGGVGKAVGPDLSEIGSKLSREAMFLSILDPSAGISHNYENMIALLDSGSIVNGILVTENEETLVLRSAEAIDITIPAEEVIELKKSEKSIMPENLHQTTDQQGLVDLVEYLLTLKKA